MAGSLRMVVCLAAAGGELSGTAVRFLWERLSRRGRLGRSLERLEETGKIRLVGAGHLDQRILRLTEDGRRAAQGGIDPPSCWSRPWDRRWRIVAFDIPEASAALRTRLRRRLHEFRFGWLQNSVWLSPDPIDEFRAKLHEKTTFPDSLTFLEASPVGGESNDAMVSAAWDFPVLAKGYADYLEILRLRPGSRRPFESWVNWLRLEQRGWRRIVRLDPFLPRELLPAGYRGEQVWAARQEAFGEFGAALTKATAT